ncbi:MAG: RNA-binding protein [Psychromonas sp.]|nr:RNA-binding protein [Alteromonadales bacterium]MCP5078072.1 RNA-binding protein [Psychromonas sp.]
MKLLVRNLAVATTEEKLVSLFSEHGKVQSCSLVLDNKTGKSKGFGFIEMPKAGEAKAAMKTLNGFKLAGNIIRVKKAEAKQEDAVVVEKKAAPVQFKQAPKAPAVKESANKKAIDDAVQDAIDNTDNAANLYGKVKQSDDY